MELVPDGADGGVAIGTPDDEVRPSRARALVIDRRDQRRSAKLRARQHFELHGREWAGVGAIFGTRSPVVGTTELEAVDCHARLSLAGLNLASGKHLCLERRVRRDLEGVIQRPDAIAAGVSDSQLDGLLVFLVARALRRLEHVRRGDLDARNRASD